MIELDEAARKAIDNARALTVAMIEHGWGTVHVASSTGEFFLAKESGHRDPLSPVASAAPVPAVAIALPVATAAAPAVEIKAPHIATVVSLVPVGTAVAAGQILATLRVLDTTSEVFAPTAGTIAGHGAAVGDLAEFGTVLVRLQP